MPLDVLNWILDFLGVNNTYNDFSTHMYNFWSGFGGGIIQFSLLGALLAIYHRSAVRLKSLETTLHKPLEKIEERHAIKHDEKINEDK
jgi:hypothetical protein